MSDFVAAYEPYNSILINELGLDWYEVQETYGKIGNTPGMYPDSAMFLMEIVKRDDVQNILEIGSGISTLYLAKTAKVFNKNFISIEEDPKYQNMTELLCHHYGVDQQVLIFEDMDYSMLPKPDVLFIDSDTDSRTTLLETIEKTSTSKWHPKDIDFILLDDAEAPIFIIPVLKALARYGRFNHSMYNPVARSDRHLFINYIDDDVHIPSWYWDWRPDKKYW